MSPAAVGMVVVILIQIFRAFVSWPPDNTCLLHDSNRRKITIPWISSDEKPEPNFVGQGRALPQFKFFLMNIKRPDTYIGETSTYQNNEYANPLQ